MNRTEFIKIAGLVFIFGLSPILTSLILTQNHNGLKDVNKTNKISYQPKQENISTSTNSVTNQPELNDESTPKVESAQTEESTQKVTTPVVTKAEPNQPIPINCSGNLTSKFLCLLNNYRSEKGLGEVSLNSSLSQVAVSHSAWMNETRIFSHTGINGSRLTERCAAAGIRCLAENLAEGIYSANELLSNWQANPSHNKNLLGPYTTIGLGVSGDYVTLLLN